MPQEPTTHLLKILPNEILKSSVGPELSFILSCLNHLLTEGFGGSSNKVTEPETGFRSDTQAGTLGKRLGAVSKDARQTD